MDIIEVIDDDVDAFGDSAPNHVQPDDETRRWVRPAVVAMLAALIGYGLASSASSSDAPSAATASTTTASTTSASTAPPALHTTFAATVPFLAAELPATFGVHYASVQATGGALAQTSAYELWATKGASANSGSWFSVTTTPGASTLSASNAYRVESDGVSIAISHVSGGQAVTRFTVDGFGVSITSFGWNDDDLVRLAGAVHPAESAVEFTDAWFTPGHRIVSTVQPWLAVQSIVTEQISYVSADDPTAAISITVGRRTRNFDRGAAGDRYFALRFLLADSTPFDVNGLPAVAGKIVGQSDDAMAAWIDGDNVITVSSPMTVADVIDVARTVHQVPSSEWEGMKAEALRVNSPRSAIVPSQVPSVSSGVDAESLPWAIGVTMSYSGRQRHVNWRWAGSGVGSVANDRPQITTLVDNARTYVLADLPRSSTAPTAHLQVVRAGLDPIVVPFNDAGSAMDRTFAAYVFSEATPYTAEIVDDDGAILAAWPAT
ncbi:MAG: hypothetical protein ABI706_20720 [Ilumatobacteraceae bacterium]